MFDAIDPVNPKSLTDEELFDRVMRCRKYLCMSNIDNKHGLLDSVNSVLLILEEELSYRNQKKYSTPEKEKKDEDTFPINLGTVSGETNKYAQKQTKN